MDILSIVSARRPRIATAGHLRFAGVLCIHAWAGQQEALGAESRVAWGLGGRRRQAGWCTQGYSCDFPRLKRAGAGTQLEFKVLLGNQSMPLITAPYPALQSPNDERRRRRFRISYLLREKPPSVLDPTSKGRDSTKGGIFKYPYSFRLPGDDCCGTSTAPSFRDLALPKRILGKRPLPLRAEPRSLAQRLMPSQDDKGLFISARHPPL